MYTVYRKDRDDGYGGVVTAVKSDINHEVLQLDPKLEACIIKIQTPGSSPVIIASVYRPPNRDIEYMNLLCDSFESIAQRYKNAVLWIGGDLNLPDISWSSHSIEGSQYPRRVSERFLEMVYTCSLEQSVQEPTRLDKTLDLFLTNRPTLVNRCCVIPGLGDHEAVCIDTSVKASIAKPVKRKIPLWNKANIGELKADCLSFQEKFLEEFDTKSLVNTMWSSIKENLLSLMSKHVPTKTASSRYNQPWINTNLKRLSRRKKRSYIMQKGKPKNSKEHQRYKALKRKTEKECKNAHDEYMKNVVSPESNNNSKKFWSYIKSRKNDNTGVAPLKDEHGVLHTDSNSKADILNRQFSSVFNKNENIDTIPDKGPSPHPNINQITINSEGVWKLLTNLKPHKATGPDNIPTRLLKELAKPLAPIFTTLFQASLDQGTVPEDWKKANVVPIYKKGSKFKAENYRPVSLTCIASKLLEHIVTSNIMKHLDSNKILTDTQHGFRKRRSCETQLIPTVQQLAKSIDDKQQIDSIFLDFSKAFDKVPFERLKYKLQWYGICGDIHKWISDFLTSRTQQVTIDGISSPIATVDSGVPQGSVIGPLLFLLYINDLPDYLTNGSKTNLFADDSILYRPVNSPEDSIKLQCDLDNLEKWESDWLMSFHPSKCQVMHITNKRSRIETQYKIHGESLETVDSTKYLGVNLQENLSWNNHVNQVAKKANNTCSFLYRNLKKCSKETKELAYRSMVRPILEYASPVWDPHTQSNINQLERVQRRAARFVHSNFYRTSSVSSMLQSLNWPLLQERRAQAKVVMMYRIVYNLVDIPTVYLIPTINTRGSQHYLVPFARTQCYQRSFFPDTIRLWNNLPSSVTSCTTLESFKTVVQSTPLR